jgi:hypothetical protein
MGFGEICAAVRQRFSYIGKKFEGIPAKLGPLLYDKAAIPADKILARIPPDMRRPVLFGLGGAVFLLIIIVALMLANRAGKSRESGDLPAMPAGPAIPAEELFLPAEPDFLPQALLEREPYRSWTAEDAAPYWKNLKNGRGDEWREESRAVIDELMESVP